MPTRSTQAKQSHPNNVSCRNINVIAKYVHQKLGSDVLLTSNLSYMPEYLLNEHNWIPLHTYNEIMNRAITLLNDPDAPYKMGLSAMELESWGIFKYIQKIFLTVVIDPVIVYQKINEYNPLFNNTKDFHLLSTSDTHCVFKVVFHPDVNPVDDYHSDRYIQGLLASIPQIWNLPSSAVKSISNEYDVLDLLHKKGGIPRHEIEIKGDHLLVGGDVVGKRIPSYSTELWWKDIVKDAHNVTDPLIYESLIEAKSKVDSGIVITKEFKANDIVHLKVGEIYNAPHFLYHISWAKPPLSLRFKHLLFKQGRSRKTYENAIVASLSTIKGYTETLEQKVIERTQELELAKRESEYWRSKADELLSTMLPEHIAQKMIEKELESQEVYGTVLYTDIVGFTEYSKNNSEDYVDQELKLYFAEITNIVTRHGGWVNKFLGDGMLVIFGLNGDTNATVNAAKAAKQIVDIIEQYSWGTRVSLSTGPFTIGEYGNGALRRFDCMGNVLNLGSRLQNHADKNQILVCENTYKNLITETKDHSFGAVRNLDVKGIGEVVAYPLITR
jgi:class 3 adenylate cyclase